MFKEKVIGVKTYWINNFPDTPSKDEIWDFKIISKKRAKDALTCVRQANYELKCGRSNEGGALVGFKSLIGKIANREKSQKDG